jgi:hypothetical protein
MDLVQRVPGGGAADEANQQATFATPIVTLLDRLPPGLSPILLSVEYAFNLVHYRFFAKSGNDVV